MHSYPTDVFGITVIHDCHADNEPCPPCTVLTEKRCMGGHEVQPLKSSPCTSLPYCLFYRQGRIFHVTCLTCLVVHPVGKICHVGHTSVNVSATKMPV